MNFLSSQCYLFSKHQEICSLGILSSLTQKSRIDKGLACCVIPQHIFHPSAPSIHHIVGAIFDLQAQNLPDISLQLIQSQRANSNQLERRVNTTHDPKSVKWRVGGNSEKQTGSRQTHVVKVSLILRTFPRSQNSHWVEISSDSSRSSAV